MENKFKQAIEAEKMRLLKAKLPAMVRFRMIADLNVILRRIERDKVKVTL